MRRSAKNWANTPTGRVTMNTEHRPSPIWQAAFAAGSALREKMVADGLLDPSLKIDTADYSAIEQRILARMSMSRDRVRFNLAPYGADQATKDAFYKAFGAPFPSRPMGDIVIIVCRPSQFARFMIYRNEFGGRNSFKELAPVLFTPDAPKSEIDVSGNPAQ